jgi:hypothetical protein
MKERRSYPAPPRTESEKPPTTLRLNLDTKIKVLKMAETAKLPYEALVKKSLSLGLLVMGYKAKNSPIFERNVLSGKPTELTVQVKSRSTNSYTFGNIAVEKTDESTAFLIGAEIPDVELTAELIHMISRIAKTFGQDTTASDVAEGMIDLGLRIIGDSMAKKKVYHVVSEKNVEIIDDILNFPKAM